MNNVHNLCFTLGWMVEFKCQSQMLSITNAAYLCKFHAGVIIKRQLIKEATTIHTTK